LGEGRIFLWCGYDKIFGSGKFQLDRIALTGSCGSHEIFGDPVRLTEVRIAGGSEATARSKTLPKSDRSSGNSTKPSSDTIAPFSPLRAPDFLKVVDAFVQY
jgi:hypothetical protein